VVRPLISVGVAIGVWHVLVQTSDPITFVVVTILFAVVALLACLLPSLRATRVDPMSALRYE